MTPPATRERGEFRPDVEGLRAVAVLLVVLYHAHLGLPGGYVGVDVFFVISGFLITSQLVRELASAGRISLLGFYARRARRILPAVTLTTIATAAVSVLVLSPVAALRALNDARAAAVFGANIHFAAQGADYFNATLPPSPVQHYWSLAVEEQFYIVWPLVLVASSLVWWTARRRRMNLRSVVVVLAALAAGSLLASVAQTSESTSWAYYSLLTRAWELAVGALAALALPVARRLHPGAAAPLSWLGVGCIAVAALAFDDATPYPGDAALLPVAGAAAIVVAGSASRRSRRQAEAVLGIAPFQRLGAWSYSWYLWHWPVLLLAPAVLGHALSDAEALTMAVLSLLIAVLSFVLVERPIRRMPILVRRPALGLAVGGALVAACLGCVAASGALIGPLTSGPAAAAPARAADHSLTASQLAADLRAGARTRRVPANLRPRLVDAAEAKPVIVRNGCHLQETGVRSKPCIYGDTKARTAIVLFGDSHAAAWFPALDLISRRHHWRLVDISKAGCPPVEVDISAAVRRGAVYRECRAWRRNAKRQIAALHPALVVVSWARFLEVPEARPLPGVPAGSGGPWANGVASIFAFLRASSRHVLFLSDGPTLRHLVPDCVSGHLRDVRPCMTGRRAATRLPRVKARELALARRAGVAAADPMSWFCTRSVCPVIVGNILLYRDDAHMVPAWSRFLAPVLAARIRPLMAPPTTLVAAPG